jgi:polyhydroxyalkanoate synthesis regulator phasin
MAQRGHTEDAIKTLRKQTKLTPHEATLVVQALMVGRTFPAPEVQSGSNSRINPMIDDDLLRRLHALVAQDPVKRTAAMQLLRDRTGMNAREARRFVNAL